MNTPAVPTTLPAPAPAPVVDRGHGDAGMSNNDRLASYDPADLPRIVSYVFQPIVDLTIGHVVRLEALARVLSSDGRVIGPERLIAYLAAIDAEELLTQLTVERVTAAAARLAQAGLAVPISLNLMPSQLTIHVPDQLDAACDTHKLPRRALAIEVVEAPALGPEAMLSLEMLARRGYPLLRDDVGAGVADLLAIAALPFAGLKLDRALVARVVAGEPRATAVVRAIAGLGRELGAHVVAEGVEDLAAARTPLLLTGVREAQGYGIARPTPLESLLSLLVRSADGRVWVG